jgi:hypothetical protein
MTRHTLAIVLVMACVASHARADALLDQKGEFGPEAQSETQQVAFEVPEDTPQLLLNTTVTLKQGKASVQVVSPKGTKLFDVSTSGSMTLSRSLVRTEGEAGTFHVMLVPDEAVGTWSRRHHERSKHDSVVLAGWPCRACDRRCVPRRIARPRSCGD